jgi:NADH:ubiquinone oxidoreductase subunit F (NADH-binding)
MWPMQADRGARAQTRAVDSFFADRHADPAALRICEGTSCALAGAAELRSALAASGPCRRIYCAGYCDRSPVALLPDGRPVRLARAALGIERLELESLPEIRSWTPRAVVTERVGRGSFHELGAARAAGAWLGFERALARGPAWALAELERSEERGRGGGAFPTGTKWRAAATEPSPVKYAIANGDEGDPGSFIDRVLLEADPHAVLAGLALCGLAIGAQHGIVYVRSEYPRAAERVERAIDEARAAGLLGARILGTEFGFEVRVARGQGSYVCGEETALLEALEGRRGEVRLRPPYPTTHGLHGRPTVVDNVETLVNAAWIAREGADPYRALGTAASRGTKALCLNAGFARPGIVEVEFGTSLAQVIEEAAPGSPPRAVALGGPMGSILARGEWEVPVCWEAMAARGISLGHGGIVALGEETDFRALLSSWLEFMVDESCGKCAPCAAGSARALSLARAGERDRLLELLEVISAASLCPFGQDLPKPVRALVERFGALDRRP